MAIATNQITTVYPMDSVVTGVDTDGLPLYDRAYNASDLRTFMSLFVTDGVWTDYLDELTPVRQGGSWYVGAGAAMADGLLIPVEEQQRVVDQAEITTGTYAYICVAAQFDSAKRCGETYARLSSSSSEQPIRTESTHELILARIDWRGTMTDLRMDNSMCGPVTAILQPDTVSFVQSLYTAVDQFNLNVGEVTTGAPGSTPVVTVRKPTVAGEEVYIDFTIPRGPKGDPGEDGLSAPTCYINPASDEPPRVYGNVWMVDDKATHTITAIRCYETEEVYPGDAVYPGDEVYPGGAGQWVSHLLSPSLVPGGGGGTARGVSVGSGAPTSATAPGAYIDADTGDLYRYDD